MPGLSGAADEARDRLVDTFVKYKYIHTFFVHASESLVGQTVLYYSNATLSGL